MRKHISYGFIIVILMALTVSAFSIDIAKQEGVLQTLRFELQKSGRTTLNKSTDRSENMIWKFEGVSTGGKYTLMGVKESSSSDTGCCCAYLPCVLRSQ